MRRYVREFRSSRNNPDPAASLRTGVHVTLHYLIWVKLTELAVAVHAEAATVAGMVPCMAVPLTVV
ncbi:hypothetical protein XFF7766_280012 [Xanthomonas citri pv. fuscans]|nr:hypothetical protein XFF7766_280012 [Xanthomonas citri pv. fuscans]